MFRVCVCCSPCLRQSVSTCAAYLERGTGVGTRPLLHSLHSCTVTRTHTHMHTHTHTQCNVEFFVINADFKKHKHQLIHTLNTCLSSSCVMSCSLAPFFEHCSVESSSLRRLLMEPDWITEYGKRNKGKWRRRHRSTRPSAVSGEGVCHPVICFLSDIRPCHPGRVPPVGVCEPTTGPTRARSPRFWMTNAPGKGKAQKKPCVAVRVYKASAPVPAGGRCPRVQHVVLWFWAHAASPFRACLAVLVVGL